MPRSQRAQITLVALVAMLGALVMTGWHLRIDAVVQVRPSFAPMQYNTALCLLITTLALLFAILGRAKAAGVLAAVVIVFTASTVSEYVTGIALGLDELFVRPDI